MAFCECGVARRGQYGYEDEKDHFFRRLLHSGGLRHLQPADVAQRSNLLNGASLRFGISVGQENGGHVEVAVSVVLSLGQVFACQRHE